MSECILWTGAVNSDGYGQRWINGKCIKVHRIACEEAHGPSPEGKPHALHTCDNPPCINGDHLFWGSHQDNMKDMADKGRARLSGATHCKRGHEFTEENTYRYQSSSSRACRVCRTAAMARYRSKKKEKN